MKENKAINLFPKFSIKAYDGMSVTADIWQAAHSEHRMEMCAHNLGLHQEGIKFGLEVKANDPADHYVFISPGVAVDGLGREIVVDQTIAYDFGDEGEGTYLLLLGYGEREVEDTGLSVQTMKREYIVAARPDLPKQPVIELARVNIHNKNDMIMNAHNPFDPAAGELDLRYRLDKPWTCGRINLGVVALGKGSSEINEGWQVLQQSLPYMIPMDLTVDTNVKLDAGIDVYDAVHLYLDGDIVLTEKEMNVLRDYYKNGNRILLEGVSEAAFDHLLKGLDSLGIQKADPVSNPIYHLPFFFRKPPEEISADHLYSGNHIILFGDQTSKRWSGNLAGRDFPRDEIRTNMEWAVNLLMFCVRN